MNGNRNTSADERRDWLELLTAGDAMLGLVHEINNSLNCMMLQASIVELKVTGSVKDDVAEIRRLGVRAAKQLALIQQFRDQCRNSRSPIDLNQFVREAFPEDPQPSSAPELALAEPPLTLSVNPGALSRLIRLLPRIVRHRQPDAVLRIQTLLQERQISLIVESKSFRLAEARSVDWESISDEWADLGHLMECVAAHSLARLVKAQGKASVGASGELSLRLTWPQGETSGRAL